MKKQIIQIIIIVLLFSIDLSSYLSSFASISILKIIVYSIALLAMVIDFDKNGKKLVRTGIWVYLVIYITILFIRIYYEFVLCGTYFFMYKSSLTIIYFFLNVIIIPALFFYFRKINISYIDFATYLGTIVFFCMAISAYNIFVGNAVVAGAGDRFQGNDLIDIIYYGHIGVSLALIGIYICNNYKHKFQLYFAILFILLGILSAILSGSRGPFIALIVCLGYYTLFSVRHKRAVVILFLIGFLISATGIIIDGLIIFNDFLSSHGFNSFNRVINSLLAEDDVSSGRTSIFSHGFDLFLSSPIIGKSYLLEDGSTVHNIIIEQFMALGIIGGVLFLIINIKAIIMGGRIIKNNPDKSIIPLLFMQYFVFGLFSRTIIALTQYWLFLFLIINIYEFTFLKNEKRTRLNNNSDI